jgi:PEP-CTERM motif-containing protein
MNVRNIPRQIRLLDFQRGVARRLQIYNTTISHYISAKRPQKGETKMKVQIKHLVAVATVFLAFSSGTAFADLVASWSFDTPTGTVGPTDTITMDATLTNDSTSTVNITSVTVFSLSEGTFAGVYDFGFGPGGGGDPFTQFSGLDLAPGNSFGFVFGVFAPLGGSAPAGTYDIDSGVGTFITFNDVEFPSTNGFERTVATVPEPSTLLLIATGLTGLTGLTFLRKRWALD